MSTSKRRLTISLVAHTNVGKTTLARTLLRRDVGEVLDQAHVTEISEAYPLIETDEALLCLWDTPGLGDTVRLVRRLKKEGSPVGWFLHQVWDRQRDRPLWCSQEALRNVREDADVVLYLVNAGESPADAGYVPLELEILNWVGRPTLVVLNQTGGTAEEARRLSDEWRAFLADQPVVRGVLALDAFTRSWVQEDQLFERVTELFDGPSHADMDALAKAWRRRNRSIFEESMAILAEFLAAAAVEQEPLSDSDRKSMVATRAAAEALLARIEAKEASLWITVVAAHSLEGRLASEAMGMLDELAPRIELASLVDQFVQLLEEHRNTVKGAAGGALMIGLAADILSGGLTLGGGTLVGGLLGGALGKAVDRFRGRGKDEERDKLRLSTGLLTRLTVDCLRRYLLLAHYGRGRGDLRSAREAERWRAVVEETLAPRAEVLVELVERARSKGAPAVQGDFARELATVAELILGNPN